jgi:polar amino acid transport system substrate-binding protein
MVEKPQAKLQLFNDESRGIQELRSGRVHALVASAPLPAFLALEYRSAVPFQVRPG